MLLRRPLLSPLDRRPSRACASSVPPPSIRPPSIPPASFGTDAPPRGPRDLRPWYLVVAMVLTWFIGLNDLTASFSTFDYLREGRIPDTTTAMKEAEDAKNFGELAFVVRKKALLEATMAHQHVTFPLSVGRLLLGGMLVVASGMAMAGRPGARSFALQALTAMALFAVVEFVLLRDVRGAAIDAVIQAGQIAGLPAAERALLRADVLWWMVRVMFVLLELGPLVAAAIALTRRRTKRYFAAVAATVEGAEGP